MKTNFKFSQKSFSNWCVIAFKFYLHFNSQSRVQNIRRGRVFLVLFGWKENMKDFVVLTIVCYFFLFIYHKTYLSSTSPFSSSYHYVRDTIANVCRGK